MVVNTGKPVDLTGQRFGMLTVLGVSEDVYIDPKRGYKYKKWDCQCDCGNIISVRTSALTCKSKGSIRSCGCVRMQHMLETRITHGESHTRLYKIWLGMKKRCYNENCKSYKNYGGRGIRVCDEWLNDFEAFKSWAINNGYKTELSIDRIDVNGDYSPDNCRWSDDFIQANNRRSNHLLEFNGEIKTIAAWAEEYGLNYHTLFARLDRGWDVEESLTIPMGKYTAGQRKKAIKYGIYEKWIEGSEQD